jgi:hypothetical protein
MRIVKETSGELVIKRVKSQASAMFIGLSILAVILTIIMIGVVDSGMVQPRGKSRPTSGAIVFLLPLLILPAYFFDKNSNKKALTINSDNQTVTIVGKNTQQIGFADIKNFRFGKAFNEVLIIELELNNGQIKSSGINAPPKDPISKYVNILEKLNTRLNKQNASEEKNK